MDCPDCAFSAKSRAGLAAHQRRAHVDKSAPAGPNAQAIDVTLAELRRMGRLEKVNAAQVQALRSMAEALDQNPFNSQMWKEYREAIGGLTASDDSGSTAVDDLLNELSTSVRDSPQT